MNKYFLIGLILVGVLGLVVAEEVIIPQGQGEPIVESVKNIQISLEKPAIDELKKGIDLNKLTGIKYALSCTLEECKAILNQEGLFQDREITFSIKQTCTEYETQTCEKYYPTPCKTIDANKKCIAYEPNECKNWTTPTCKTWTNISKEEFTETAILKELEFVSAIRNKRINQTKPNTESTGTIEIKQKE